MYEGFVLSSQTLRIDDLDQSSRRASRVSPQPQCRSHSRVLNWMGGCNRRRSGLAFSTLPTLLLMRSERHFA